MRHLCLLLLTYTALLLDADSGSWSLPVGTAPHFLLLAAAIAVLVLDGAGAIGWAVFIGVLTDSLGRGPIGMNMVVLANLVFFSQIIGSRSLRDSVFAGGAFVWGFVTLASLISITLRRLLHGDAIDLTYLSMESAGRAGGGVIVFLTVMLSWRVVRRVTQYLLPSVRVGRERREWATRGV